MSQLEPYLTDEQVLRVQEKLYDEFPILQEYQTDFVSARIDPPWHGLLPNGKTGWTNSAVVQFVAVSDHPRPIQKKMGVRHGTTAVVWERAFEASVRESKHFVDDRQPPEERIFRLLAAKHIEEMKSLSSIISDAVSDPSKPKSVFDVL